MSRPVRLPAAVLGARLRQRADRSGGRADRGRRPHRRRRPGRPRLRDPARPAHRGATGGGGAARRGAGRGAREGQAARLAPPLRCGREPEGAPPPLRGQASGWRTCRPTARCPASRSTSSRAARRCRSRRRRRCGTTATGSSRCPQLGRFLAEQAEEGGAMILPETAAQKLLVSHGRVVGVRTGDKGRGREGERARRTSRPAPTSWRRSRCSPRGRRAT